MDEIVFGVFKKELPNRFMAEVVINNKSEICYVKSSSRLENFIDLKGKTVILKRNLNSKFRYYVYAVKFKCDFILLCPIKANSIVYDNIESRKLSFLGNRKNRYLEYNISNYKSDIYLEKTKTIIEIKSVISKNNESFFPTVYSERFEKQLDNFESLLLQGYKVVLLIVAFNPYTRSVHINNESRAHLKLKRLLSVGLIIKSLCLTVKNGENIKKIIPTVFDDME